jgi:hypothetical protein
VEAARGHHDLAADAGGADYGTEVDASVVFTLEEARLRGGAL